MYSINHSVSFWLNKSMFGVKLPSSKNSSCKIRLNRSFVALSFGVRILLYPSHLRLLFLCHQYTFYKMLCQLFFTKNQKSDNCQILHQLIYIINIWSLKDQIFIFNLPRIKFNNSHNLASRNIYKSFYICIFTMPVIKKLH